MGKLASAPRQLFSGRRIKYVQLNKGCSCASFSPAELGAAAAALANQTQGPPGVLGAQLGFTHSSEGF